MRGRIWANLPLKDFMANAQYELAKENIGILTIVQNTNMHRRFGKTDGELKEYFIKEVNSFLQKHAPHIRIEDCRSIWSAYEVSTIGEN